MKLFSYLKERKWATILGAVNRGSGIQMPSLPETQGPSLGEQTIRSLIEASALGSIAYVFYALSTRIA